MRRLLRILFISVFFIFALFIGQEVFACNISSNLNKLVVSAPKPKDIALNKPEEYYIVLNGHKREEISNRSGRNNFYSPLNNEYGFISTLSGDFVFENNIFSSYYISYNISPRLKNTINTRAP